MILKNDDHGIMMSYSISDLQKQKGWYEITEAELMELAGGEVAEEVSEPDTPDIDFDAMTKKELEVYARDFNIELDRRMSKKNMLKDFNEQLGD